MFKLSEWPIELFVTFGQHALSKLKETGDQVVEWIKSNIPEDIDDTSHVLQGRVYAQILSLADKLDVGPVVMGSHTLELSDYLIGPNAARIVRHARQSVLVARGDKAES